MKRLSLSTTPALEWIAAGLGLALLLVVFSVTVRSILLQDNAEPPIITVEAKRISPAGRRFLVEFVAINTGGSTAAAVEIQGDLMTPDGRETATVTLDYVAGGGRAPGGLFFNADPRKGSLKLWAGGFQEP